MSSADSSSEPTLLNDSHVYEQEGDARLISFPAPRDIATVYVGILKDRIPADMYEKITFSSDGSDHINIRRVDASDVEEVFDIIEEIGDDIISVDTIAPLKTGEFYTTNPSLEDKGIIDPTAHHMSIVFEEIEEAGGLWANCLEDSEE